MTGEAAEPEGVSPRGQILVAAVIRTIPGIILPTIGAFWLFDVYGIVGIVLVVPFAGFGLAKASFLRRGAVKSIARMRERGHVSFAKALPPATLALIAGMMLLGQVLRRSGIPFGVLGLIYLAVGLGLLVSTVDFWTAWLAMRGDSKEERT